MKLNAVAISTSNMSQTIKFYSLLGFDFSEASTQEDHVEPKTPTGSARLMIDKKSLLKQITGEDPQPATHSSFAIEYNSPEEVNQTAQKIQAAGFTVTKQPWDAFWGQRYAIVEDPDGYKVDLYAPL